MVSNFKKIHIRFLRRASVILILSALTGIFVSAFLYSNILFDLVASSISSFTGATTTLFFVPYGDTSLSQGATATIDITINTKAAINALGATIVIPKDSLEVVGISKEKSFLDLWTEDTSIDEDNGEIRFSGGTTKVGGLIGTGTVLTLTVRAKNTGSADIAFKNIQVFPNNNSGKPIDTQVRMLTFTVIAKNILANPGASVPVGAVAMITPPNADFNGDGKVNLVDLSILTFKMLSGYNARYDLNSNGSVGIDDISVLLSKM